MSIFDKLKVSENDCNGFLINFTINLCQANIQSTIDEIKQMKLDNCKNCKYTKHCKDVICLKQTSNETIDKILSILGDK